MTQSSMIFRAASAVRLGFRYHGVSLPFVMGQRLAVFIARKFLAPKSFIFNGKTYRYTIHPYVLDNERTVEVAIGAEFVRGKGGGEVLEVGNVLTNFVVFAHDVVDKYEVAPGVINEDIVTYAPGKKYAAIVTLSTLEHVGWDDPPRNPEKLLQAVERLKLLLAEGGEMLATMPIGYNSYLDQIIRERRTGFSEVKFLLRVSADNQWREATFEEALTRQFGQPYACANAIMVGLYRAPGRGG